MTADASLSDVIARPWDDEPRLAYAALLEAADPHDARAELIRLQIRLGRESFAREVAPGEDLSAEVGRRMSWLMATDRQTELLTEYGRQWSGVIGETVTEYAYDRGFICRVTLPARQFLATGPLLLDEAPIVMVKLTGVAEVAEELFVSPTLRRLPALSLGDNGLTDEDARRIAGIPFERLWWLDLGFNRIGMPGVEALAASESLRRLVWLGLDYNPADPRETAGVEGMMIQHVVLPPEGQALEAKYGPISWLHFPSESMVNYPPNPCRGPER
jgi:uncharacterized protein (TIGR02996 family)